MALDIYAGSMARFYLRAFRTPLQSYADNLGLRHSFLTPPPEGLSAEETNIKLLELKHNLYKLAGEEYPDICQWNDKETEYHVRQLHYICLDSLYIVARCAYHPEIDRPRKILENQVNYPDFPPLTDIEKNDGVIDILTCHLYLPSESSFFLETKDILKRDVVLTTLAQLKFGLSMLAKKVWNNKIESIKWLKRGAILDEKGVGVEDVVLNNAQYAFAVLHTALGFALHYNVPIMLEFEHKAELIQDGNINQIDPVLVDAPEGE